MKPILACDLDYKKVKYPLMVFPKIDGVRGLNLDGTFTGRSGKSFKNKLNTKFYSDERFRGFDGEQVVCQLTGHTVCSETTSALTTINGTIETRWCLFDYVLDGLNNEDPYVQRYEQLGERYKELTTKYPELRSRLWVVPYEIAHNRAKIEELELKHLEAGFEGLILRDPNGTYKYGRTTPREANYLRKKNFVDAEIVVTRIAEGTHNANELKRNPHGYAERSTVGANMVPNGMVGTIYGRALADKIEAGRLVLEKDQEVEVSPGKMTHEARAYYFNNQSEIVGKIVKFKFFPIGIKDKPRFPTFQSFRSEVDL